MSAVAADWRSLARAARESGAAPRASSELIALTERLLSAEGYAVLPIRSACLGAELTAAFDLVADADVRLLVAVCELTRIESCCRELWASGAAVAARAQGECVQVIGWKRDGGDWRCRRVGLVVRAQDSLASYYAAAHFA